jgi:hypothetical protein
LNAYRLNCSLSLCLRPVILKRDIVLLGDLERCSLAKQPSVAFVAIEDEEVVAMQAEVEEEMAVAVSALVALVVTGNLHP